jgi:hypothetical protein
VVAIPLALTVQAAFVESRSEWRTAALTSGSILTLAWLIAFRTGIALSLPFGAPLWVIVAGTILLPVFLVWQSERVSRQERSATPLPQALFPASAVRSEAS